MALSCKKGSFVKGTGANNSTQQITIGFQAKAIIFWWTTQTAEGYTDTLTAGIGFADGSAVAGGCRAVFGISDDNAASSVTDRWDDDDRCIKWGSSGGANQQESHVSAIDGTTFTLTHNVNQAVAVIIHYMAIGGDDITDTDVGTFTTTTATGNQSITSLAFQPDFVIMATKKHTSVAVQNHVTLIIGMASDSTHEGSLGIIVEDARTTMDTWRTQVTDKCLKIINPGSGALDGEAEFTQFTTTGFDINWTDANDNAALVHFLAIKGGNPFVGNLLQPTSNGVQTYNTITDMTPKGVMLFSFNNAATSTIQSHARMSIGGTDGTDEGCIWVGDSDNVADSITARRTVTDKAIGLSTEAATGSSSTTNAEADTDSLNSGNFKLDWTTTDATESQVLFFAFSEEAAGGEIFQRTIDEGAVTIGASSITVRARRVISDSAITIGASSILTRIKRPITESAVSEDDILTPKAKRPITDSAVTIGASTISTKAKRPILDSLSIDDTISRIASFFRTIDEDSVAEDDTLTPKAKRPVSESGVSIADSLTLRIKRVIADSLSISDSITKRIRLIIAEATVTVAADNISVKLVRRKTINEDAITEDDSIALKIKRVILDSLSIDDTISRILSARRTINEPGVSSSDSITMRARRIISDSAISIADTLSLKVKRPITDSAISILDNISRLASFKRTINEPSVSQSDSITPKAKRPISETVSIAASTITVRIKRIITDAAVVIDDLLTGELAVERVTINEPAVPISDTSLRTKVYRVITDSVSIADNIIKKKIYHVIISEPAVVISDAITRIRVVIQGAGQRLRRRFYGRDYSFR